MSNTGTYLEKQNPIVLAVGGVFEWHQAEISLPAGAKVIYSTFSEIRFELLRDVCPDIVLSCLVSRDFDFLDLAQVLQAVQFKGCFRIITPKLPNPGIVLSEARTLCPDLKIEFDFDPSYPGGALN